MIFQKKLGIRQQTVSEWETGAYLPRGGSLTLLNMIAENIEASLFQGNENISGKVVEKSMSSKNFKVKKLRLLKRSVRYIILMYRAQIIVKCCLYNLG